MLKVYTGQLLSWPHLPILYPNLGFQKKTKYIFISNAFSFYRSPVFEIVSEPGAADYFLIPHDYFFIQNERKYLDNFISLAEINHKPILVFTHSDYVKKIPIENSVVFRTSQYRYNKKPNEIIMPAYAEDLSAGKPIVLRHKNSKPTAGFCGWADFQNLKQRAVFFAKYAAARIFNGNPANVHGLWFRRRAIRVLEHSSLVRTNFIIRKSFSSHKNTISLPPEEARREYIENINQSDFILAVRGGGNFSLRFYEALSLGRIPLFVDTDCVLPLENEIDYKNFVLFVDYRNLDKIDGILSDFYQRFDDEKFIEMQKKAREAFENYLRIDSFFRRVPDLLRGARPLNP